MRSYPVQVNHISSAVSEILRYKHRNTQTNRHPVTLVINFSRDCRYSIVSIQIVSNIYWSVRSSSRRGGDGDCYSLQRRISLTTEPIWLSFTVKLLMSLEKVYNYFCGGYLHRPYKNALQKKIIFKHQFFWQFKRFLSSQKKF